MEKRNIYHYKNYGELYRLVEPYLMIEDDDAIFSSASGKSLKRQERDQAWAESFIVHYSKEMIVTIPLTKRAAQWWGRGTKWCTAAEKNNYFDQYNRSAPLINIIINPASNPVNVNKNIKLQLWVSSSRNSYDLAFMDSADSPVGIETIRDYWLYLRPIIEWALEQNSDAFHYIPLEYLDIELCKQVIKADAFILESLPHELRTYELCRFSIEHGGYGLEYIDPSMRTYELCKKAVENYGWSLLEVPMELRNSEICIKALASDGSMLKHIPYDLLTFELCLKAVQQSINALSSVPHEFRTHEFYAQVIKQDKTSLAINNIPKEDLSTELYMLAVECNVESIRFLPGKLFYPELCEKAVKQKGLTLLYIPPKFITQELCELAVEQDGLALGYVPSRFKNTNLYIKAVEQNGNATGYIADRSRTLDLCKRAVANNNSAIQYVPEKLKKYFTEEVSKHDTRKEWNTNILEGLKDKIASIRPELTAQPTF